MQYRNVTISVDELTLEKVRDYAILRDRSISSLFRCGVKREIGSEVSGK